MKKFLNRKPTVLEFFILMIVMSAVTAFINIYVR